MKEVMQFVDRVIITYKQREEIQMKEVIGSYNSAKVFTDKIEETALKQVKELCNQEFTTGSKIRIMPDVHAGAGCTIGTTMTIQDKIVPNLVGVDIGCGMECSFVYMDKSEIDFSKLDEVIRKNVPTGFNVRESDHYFNSLIPIDKIRAPLSKVDRITKSLGTLGGGNHFIEVNEVDNGQIAIVIHSGSRSLGTQIAKYYQDLAYDELTSIKDEKQSIIEKLKAEGREKEIHETLRGIKRPKIKKDLAYLEGESFSNYLHDMTVTQEFAYFNRKAMMREIFDGMGWEHDNSLTTIHNYIDMENMILRKGAISAQKNEVVIIPINMRDGSILATGKGNEDWNFSGPHGAGRVLSRTKAKQQLDVEKFKETMNGVWTSTVSEFTLDEAPMAYKNLSDIVDNIGDSVEINAIMKPLYNFKADQ